MKKFLVLLLAMLLCLSLVLSLAENLPEDATEEQIRSIDEEMNYIKAEDLNVLKEWRINPEIWGK